MENKHQTQNTLRRNKTILRVETGANNANNTTILEEGKFTREEIETAAHLHEEYTVGTYTRDENFWYKVVEV